MANNAEVLIKALDYIEDHIAGEIMLQELADYCYVSVSSLQKTFKFVYYGKRSEQIYAEPHKAYENEYRARANPISEADFHGFAVRICEGTEQIHFMYRLKNTF